MSKMSSKKEMQEIIKILQEFESKALNIYQTIIFKTDNENIRNKAMELADDSDRHSKMLESLAKSLK